MAQPCAVLVIVDNRDSFTWNLVHALARFAHDVRVFEADRVTADQVLALAPSALVLSPGPGRPEEAHVCMELAVRGHTIPMLGVCLGHQVMCAALGARVQHAREPMHGRTSPLRHDESGLFAGLPQDFSVARYHSLAVEPASLSAELVPTAFADDGTLMATRHRTRPWFSLQFHPESYLTEHGAELCARFVAFSASYDARAVKTL